MLSVNKPLMDQKLNALYNVLEKAAYDARYNEGKRDLDAADAKLNDSTFDKDIKASIESNPEYIKREIDLKDKSNKFAADFVNALKQGKFIETISDEIDCHVKAIKLMINVPTLLPTIISPMGPCTGALSITEETGAQIQIL